MRREIPARVRVGIIGHVDHGKGALVAALRVLATVTKPVLLEPAETAETIHLCRAAEPVQVFTIEEDGRRSKSDRKRNPKWRNR